MKRYFIIFLMIFLVVSLTSCSCEPSFKLIDSSVTITNDRDIAGAVGITEGEKKGQELVPTILYYAFTIKNDGILESSVEYTRNPQDMGFELIIEPGEELKAACLETVGINIFDPEGYSGTGLGYGSSIALVLEPGDQAESSLKFDLGVSEKSPNANLIVPSEEKLEKLLKYASDADLVILDKGVEIGRFDLRKAQNSFSGKQNIAVANSIDFIYDSDYSMKDKIDTSVIKIENAADDTWKYVKNKSGYPVTKAEIDVSDWTITIGGSSFQYHEIIVCDSTSCSVIGYIPLD